MFEKIELSDILVNPSYIQAAILDELDKRFAGNGTTIVDPNNIFTHLVEAFSSVSSKIMQHSDDRLRAVYAKRAQTMEDLYKHLSPLEYVGIFASPASATITILFDKNYLYENAVDYNDNYKRIILPANTTFTISDITFGIYYPIEIRINKRLKSCMVMYNADTTNPLKGLVLNTIEKQEYTYNGIEFLGFEIPVYQFSINRIVEDLVAASGFRKTYDYDDNFYAVRVYHYKNNTWTEIDHTLSEDVYDPLKPTAKIIPRLDVKQIVLEIPQVYFNTELIGNKIRMDVYTTQGKMDQIISDTDKIDVGVNFFQFHEDKTEYNDILDHIPTLEVWTRSEKIVGGGNGRTYEEFRDMVVNNTLQDPVFISFAQIEAYFKSINMKVVKYLDNLTDRIYYAYSVLTDSNQTAVPVSELVTIFDPENFDEVSTIKDNLANSYTVMPGTLFEYNSVTGECIPVSDSVKNMIEGKSKSEKLEIFNNQLYTKTPYHVWINVNHTYPHAVSYDLTRPHMSNIRFVSENQDIDAEMVAYQGTLNHLNNGHGGYQILLVVHKHDILKEIPEEDLVVYVTMKSASSGQAVGMRAYYDQEYQGHSIYKVDLETDYDIVPDSIRFTNFDSRDASISLADYLNLNTKMTITYLIDPAHVSNNTTITGGTGLPTDYQNHIFMAKQECDLVFGESLEPYVHTKMDLLWSDQEYETHPVTIYHTYPQDVYERDAEGKLVYTLDGTTGKPVLNKLFAKGDLVLDGDDNPIIRHNEGDVVYNPDGSPSISKVRRMVYYVNLFHFDARLFMSEDSVHKQYTSNLTSNLRDQYNIIDTVNERLLERTVCYFKPTRTLGIAGYRQGETILRESLQLTFAFKFFVKDFVSGDTALKKLIRNKVINLIDEAMLAKKISMGDLQSLIKTKLSDYVDSIDVLGLNNNVYMQTIIPASSDTQSVLGIKLVLKEDGTYTLDRDLSIEFVPTNG